MQNKSVVKIKDATIGGGFLFGTPIDHPNSRLNGCGVRTSLIISHSGNMVETKNTIYEVQNWVDILGFGQNTEVSVNAEFPMIKSLGLEVINVIESNPDERQVVSAKKLENKLSKLKADLNNML